MSSSSLSNLSNRAAIKSLSITMSQFSHLVRFLANDGSTYYGEPVLDDTSDDVSQARQARVIQGDIFGAHTVTDQALPIQRLLAPLAPTDVGTVRCVGLNYGDHAEEANMSKPKYPLLFYKPKTALAGPNDDILIPEMAQESVKIDYECELVVIIGKQCRNVAEDEALAHVLGYSVGDDVTHRDWQMTWGEGQWSHGKGFDTWGPFGPGIATTKVIPDVQKLKMWTKLNGRLVQDATTADMLFPVAKLVSLLSRGVTLRPGDVLFTGTPPGVAMFRDPPLWLQDDDVVEVGLEHVGICINRVRFE